MNKTETALTCDKTALAKFIREQIHARQMTNEQFSEFLGVTHPTIFRYLNERIETPSIDFLLRLSVKTGTDLVALLALVYPDAINAQATPESIVLAQRIAKLPEILKNFILRALIDSGY